MNINLIYIHLGENFIDYLNDSIEQLFIFNKDINLTVVVNRNNKSRIKNKNVNLISYEKIKKTREHQMFISSNKHRTSRNRFWIYSTERFFILYEVMKQLELKRAFHIESDNMIYRDLSELYPIFRKHFGKTLGVPFDNENRGIGSFIYIPRKEILMNFLQFINKRIEYVENDMQLLSKYRIEHPEKIKPLPIINSEYHNNYKLQSQKYGICQNPEIFFKEYDNFDSIFDAAAIGQYIGGCDPRNKKNKEGFINETCIFSCENVKIEWEYDYERRMIPVMKIGNNKCIINNLHIHSKNLKKFISKHEKNSLTNQVKFIRNTNKNKYLITTFVGGPNNQYVGFRESLIMSQMLNRTLILPIFSPHGTVKNHSKRRVYHFYESFDIDSLSKEFDIITFDQVKKKPNRVFNIRNKDSKEISNSQYYLSLYKNTYDLDLCSLPQEYLGKPWFSQEKDFNYLNSIKDDVMVLCGVFNNVKLSTCGRNHCLNCDRGGPFLDIYDKISKTYIREKIIRQEAISFVNRYFGSNPFISFHMRTSDYIGKKNFTEVYIGCSEEDIYNSLVFYCNKFHINPSNIFLACPPGAFRIQDIKIINKNFFIKYDNPNKLDPYFVSLIEQEICSIATIFVRSITNTPHIPKKHTRSSWGTGVDDYRLMFNNNINDISIDKLISIYKKTDRRNYFKYDYEPDFPKPFGNIYDLFDTKNEIIKNDFIEKPKLSNDIKVKPEIKSEIKSELKPEIKQENKRQKIEIIKKKNKININYQNVVCINPNRKINIQFDNKKYILQNFLEDTTTYALKNNKNIGIDNKLKEYIFYPRGIYVDVGSYDGIKQSNTKIFEDLFGWRGILIEPNKEISMKCRQNRPSSIVEEYAIVKDDNLNTVKGDFNGHIMSSINGARLNKKKKQIEVKCITLTKLLQKYNLNSMDLLNIDTNGNEMDVIKGLDLNTFKFKFILIQLNPNYLSEHENYFKNYNYNLIENISNYNKKDNPRWSGNHNDYLFQLQ